MGIRWNKNGRRIPIYITGSGPKVLELAGKIGDGAVINTGASEDTVGYSIERVMNGIESSGRNRSDVDLSIFLFAAINEDRQVALEEAKPFATWFFVNLPEHPVVKRQTLSQKSMGIVEDYRNNYYKYDEQVSHHAPKWEGASSEASFMEDETVHKFTLAGNPEDAVKQLKELEKLGVDCFIFRVGYSRNFDRILELLADHVLPEFR